MNVNRSWTLLCIYVVTIFAVALIGFTASSSDVLADGTGGELPPLIEPGDTLGGTSSVIPEEEVQPQLPYLDLLLLTMQMLP